MVLKIRHNCKAHPFQDARYGKDMRVMNPTQKGGNTGTVIYRCTVCGSEQS